MKKSEIEQKALEKETKVEEPQEKAPEKSPIAYRARIEKLFHDPEKCLRAEATVFYGDMAFRNVRVLENANGFFVGMPQNSFKTHDGETHYEDIAYPTSYDARLSMTTVVMNEYQLALAQAIHENGHVNTPVDYNTDMLFN